MENISNFFQNIDWREIVYAAVGAFLGFGLTIVLEKIGERKNHKALLEALIKNLTVELKSIADTIEESDETSCIIIDTPIYDASIQSGNILILIEKAYYADVLTVYSGIKRLGQKENDEKLDLQSLLDYRDEIKSKIKFLLVNINKK